MLRTDFCSDLFGTLRFLYIHYLTQEGEEVIFNVLIKFKILSRHLALHLKKLLLGNLTNLSFLAKLKLKMCI